MKILIVEDDAQLGKLEAELLIRYDSLQAAPVITAVDVVGDLEAAISRLGQYDAVLCDGHFPPRAGAEASENWAVVCDRARCQGIRYVIYSGDAGIVGYSWEYGFPALPKPTAVEKIYAELMVGRKDSGARIQESERTKEAQCQKG